MKSKRIILFFLLLSSLVNIPIVKADGEGWLTGWGYRKSHEITGSAAGAQTDYQILLDVRYGSGADSGNIVWLDSKGKTDFSDIRFTNSDGATQLDYWIEIKTDSSYAYVWVEVDSIPISPNTVNIYLYYNNSGASTASNGEDTFIIFDECDNDDDWSIDYTSGTPLWGTTTLDGFSVMMVETNAHSEGIRIQYDTTLSTGRENRRAKMRIKNTNWNSDSYATFYIRDENYDAIYYQTFADFYRVYSYIAPTSLFTQWNTGHPSGWYSYQLWTNTDGKTTAYRDANKIGDVTNDGDWAGGAFQFYARQFNAGICRFYINWFFQGKYCDPEPTNTDWGSQEEAPKIEPPDLLFGAGFNASSPFVNLRWTSNLTDINFFEIQNSTDSISWDHLGTSTTNNYVDLEVTNGLERYYRIRACNFTGGAWDNSTWTEPNFEKVYFVSTGTGGLVPGLAIGIAILIIAYAYSEKRG